MTLYLIRHGKTEASEKHLYCGSTDLPLSPAGIRELAEYSEAGIYPPLRDCEIYTSGMLRADETLRRIYGQVERTVLPSLREMDFGKFEMHGYDELKDDGDYIEWISGDNERNRCPGGESGEETSQRAISALNELLAAGKNALAVSHGGPIAAIMAHLFPEEEKNRYQWQPKPGRGYAIVTDGGKISYNII